MDREETNWQLKEINAKEEKEEEAIFAPLDILSHLIIRLADLIFASRRKKSL